MNIVGDIKLFWNLIWLSITSANFYKGIEEHPISGKYYLFLCSTFTSGFFILTFSIKAMFLSSDLNNIPSLKYDGRIISDHEKVYITNQNQKPFALIDVKNNIDQIKIDKKIRFIFTKEKLLILKMETEDYTNLKNYEKLSYKNIFGTTPKTIDSNELKKLVRSFVIHELYTHKFLLSIALIVVLGVLNLVIFIGAWVWARLNLILGDIAIWNDYFDELAYSTRIKLAISIICPSIIFGLNFAIINPLLGFLAFSTLYLATASIAFWSFNFKSAKI